MNYIELYRKKKKIRKIFGKYFLPFSVNEYFLLFNFLLLLIFPAISIIKQDFGFSTLLCLLPFGYLILIIYHRFFTTVTTHLGFEENDFVVKEIASKQKNIYQSNSIAGIYIFEISVKKDQEYIVIICEKDRILINSFYERRLFNVFNKSLKSLKILILSKASIFSKKRINDHS